MLGSYASVDMKSIGLVVINELTMFPILVIGSKYKNGLVENVS